MKTLIYVFAILFSLNLSAEALSQSDFQAHVSVNGGLGAKVDPGQPFSIEMYFTDPRTGEVYKDFKLMHGKLMHMVLVKKDLSSFRHIHPYYDPATGRFHIALNLPVSDPDNQHATSVLEEPGMYMAMVDVEIRGVGMRMAHLMLHARGQGQSQDLVLDPIDADMSITKYFRRANRGTEEKPFYMARLSNTVTQGCMANLNEVFLEVHALDEQNNYVPVTDFTPWLGQGGHAIWLGEKPMQEMKMSMAHMHSEMPVDDHILRFSYFDKSTLSPGKQKIWIQFRHKDEVLTFPFVFEYYPPAVNGDNC